MTKKKRVIFISTVIVLLMAAIAILLTVIGSTFMLKNSVNNVFDEIYYSWKKPTVVHTQFSNVPAISENQICGYTYPGGNLSNDLFLVYDHIYMREKTTATMKIYPDKHSIRWVCSIDYSPSAHGKYASDEEISFVFEYDVQKKILTIWPLQASSKSLAKAEPDRYEQFNSYTDIDYLSNFCQLHGINSDDLSMYKSYFLNEVIIGFWIDGNGNTSKYTIEQIGSYELIDNSNI